MSTEVPNYIFNYNNALTGFSGNNIAKSIDILK